MIIRFNKTYLLIFVKSLFLFFAIIDALSCQKYLEKKNNTSLVTPSSLSDFQAILDNPTVMNQSRTPSYGEASCDEYFLPPDELNKLTFGSDGQLEMYTWQYFAVKGGGNDWSACYTPIYNANLVLDGLLKIGKRPDNEDKWNSIKGSALFYRSYYFLQLLWNYAMAYDKKSSANDEGIVLRLTSDFNIPSVRSNIHDSYYQVITDTKAAIWLLPKYPLISTRPSKGAAYGLLARCYLSMRDYDSALLYSDSALQLNNQLMNFNNDEDIIGDLKGKGIFKKLNKEILFYSEMNRYISINNTTSKGRIDSVLYQQYSDNDLRKTAYFYLNNDGYYSFKGSYASIYSYCFSGIATDEIVLIRAECLIRTGNIQEGLNDLNRLLSYRWLEKTYNPVKLSGQLKALDLVLLERKKELIMRGIRWMDLKRLNKEGKNIILKRKSGQGDVFILQPNSRFYALPIPEDIIEMTGIKQN